MDVAIDTIILHNVFNKQPTVIFASIMFGRTTSLKFTVCIL